VVKIMNPNELTGRSCMNAFYGGAIFLLERFIALRKKQI
jgi:hypothetical protein